MNGAIYDVAVTIVSDQGGPDPNVYVLEKDLTLPGDPWSEGWHTTNASLDYVTTLGVHANGFTSVAKATLTQRLTSELANANHISVYATGYGPDGAHKVHRNSANADGAIVINPTAAVSHAFLFHFATQSF